MLDITDEVTANGEQGLLGLAFAPDGRTFYFAFTNRNQDQQLDEIAFDGDHADATKRRTLLTIPDFAPNHNGGGLVVDADGFLYWAMGDGGGAGDPHVSGQNPKDLLGDIARIDPAHAGTDGRPYAIPPDNPFADGVNGAPEVWQYGLRNPWRFSFDRSTHDLWIADVGQGAIEEVDFVPAGTPWRAELRMERRRGNASVPHRTSACRARSVRSTSTTTPAGAARSRAATSTEEVTSPRCRARTCSATTATGRSTAWSVRPTAR